MSDNLQDAINAAKSRLAMSNANVMKAELDSQDDHHRQAIAAFQLFQGQKLDSKLFVDLQHRDGGKFSWDNGALFTIPRNGITFKLREQNKEYILEAVVTGLPKGLLMMKGDDPSFADKFVAALDTTEL